METKFNKLAFFTVISLILSLSAGAYDTSGNVCRCYGCVDCGNAMNDASCEIVNLNASIINFSGTCIFNPYNFNNKTFDCAGNEINGDSSSNFNNPAYGIYLNGKSGNRIINCRINNFFAGIVAFDSSDNRIENADITLNNYGIALISTSIYSLSDNNTISDSTINSNSRGLYLSFSNNNKINKNSIRNNTFEGIYSVQSISEIKNNTINFNKEGIYFKNSGKSLVENNTICGNDIDLNPDNFYSRYIVDNDPYKGPENASVAIVEFSDFQCLNCQLFWQNTLPEVESNYINTGKVKFVFRDYPLSSHAYAQKAAEASECAYEQGRYWDYLNKLYENSPALDVSSLKKYASDLGLNTTQFNICIDSGKYTYEVQNDLNTGMALGVTGTPSFLINGVMVVGAQPFTTFRSIIEQFLLTSDSYSNIGHENTCNGSAWNDAGEEGCTYSCIPEPVDCNCSTCGECERDLNHPLCPLVALNSDILNYSEGTCIDSFDNFNNKTFDCRGHLISGDYSGADYGIYLNSKKNNTVINCKFQGFYTGISLESSENNTIANSTAENNNNYGIYLKDSSGNIIANSTANKNTNEGIVLDYSSGNTLENISLDNNYGIDLRNSQNNIVRKSSSDGNRYGIYLYNSSNNTLSENSINKNWYGIHLSYHSKSNIIKGNTADENTNDGIYLDESSLNNTLSENNADGNIWHGIFLLSSGNTLEKNNAAGNKYGIYLAESSDNMLSENKAENNSYGIYLISHSNSNIIKSNTILSALEGIYLGASSKNVISKNTVNSNKHGIYFFDNSSQNEISDNEISDNNETGITISNAARWGLIRKGSAENTIEDNEISGNGIGIYSNNSNSTINSNVVCGNINSDFNSSDWLSSSGYDNMCNNSDSWNDTGTAGCTKRCDKVIPGDSDGNGVINIFDVIWAEKIAVGLPGSSGGNADADCNGVVNIFDVVWIERIALGLPGKC